MTNCRLTISARDRNTRVRIQAITLLEPASRLQDCSNLADSPSYKASA
jgi:hypothetical protein